MGIEPRTPSLEPMCLPTDGYRRINSVLEYILTKGQGGAILPMEDTNPQELEKIENGTSRE